MQYVFDLLPFAIIALLAALAAGAVRLAPGSPTLRERAGWSLLGVAAAYASAHWAWLFITLGREAADVPAENVIRVILVCGSVIAVYTIAPGLLRQRSADRERAEAEERFRRTMDGSAEPMALVGPDGRYRYANPASQALFRYSPTEIVGRHYSEFLTHEGSDGANLARALQSAFGRASVQRRVRRGDSSEVVIEAELIGLGDGNVLFVGHDITERVELADRLERERQRLRMAQTISHVGNGEIDLITGARWWSEEMYRLFGFEPGSTPPAFKLIWARVHPDDRAMAQAATERVQQGIGHAPFVFRLVLPDGTTRHLFQHTEIEHNADGVAVRATRVVSDVTLLQAAQADLERERRRLRLAQQVSHVGSGETNLLTGERWWSPQMYELFGIEPSDEPPPFETARLRIHPEDRARTEQSTNDIMQGKTHRPIEYRLVMPDGRIRHVLMHAHLERNDAGVPAVMTRVVVDVTELHEVQAELERERVRLRYAQEISRVGSGEWNMQTDVTWWSEEMFRLLGFEPGEAEPSRDLFLARTHPDDRDLLRRILAQLLAGYQPAPTLLRIALPDGSTRMALYQLRLERDGANGPHVVTGVLDDVTEFVALQEQLSQAKRLEAVGTLTAGIAHDFNNLLTVIGGSIELQRWGISTGWSRRIRRCNAPPRWCASCCSSRAPATRPCATNR
ncbi:MAG: PAS domain-containing protein [Dehalococcoidia bacterium]